MKKRICEQRYIIITIQLAADTAQKCATYNARGAYTEQGTVGNEGWLVRNGLSITEEIMQNVERHFLLSHPYSTLRQGSEGACGMGREG